MPVSGDPSSTSSTTICHHIRHQQPMNNNLPPYPSAADEPLIPKPNRISKSAMSTFFLLPSSSSSNGPTRRKAKKPNPLPQTSSSSFRSLGCTSSASQKVSVPAVIRSSANWDATDAKTKKTKSKKKNKGCTSSYNGGSVKILSEADRSGCGPVPDVWCGPGIGFSTDAVVSGTNIPVEAEPPRRNVPARRKIDREGSSVPPRRSHNQETSSYFDSDLTSRDDEQTQTLFSDRYHHRHIRQPYPNGLDEMMMIQNGFVMGGMLSSHDHFRDLRLNVDAMSYEQLLELGDRIGYVDTGLNEKQIKTCLCKVKQFQKIAQLEDRKCSICQEEYEGKDEVGKLRCGHRYHIHCVKQWLLRKNSCPVCKTMPYV
ncbi:uncharacterized protein LOC130497799 [Raphanus sativus]|uniref:RING-type E3 ubiquitin transferase n=1 Tax=Raphanus sativus TaxID=3726 RepID=A0A9W3C671_RAPSA|nr:uncharacterized protein LOC130497799 [Raphanus sativus]XP_056846982.1 uncharacterized protein LOC130497799 [Raphanus sativus]XP_056846983.1 uncharacterized protein LOC130497799 [Raphanus sativus]XP_056846984.1 uncharacterized protein LOC130497799 [Raphanus sativus]XP_056846985.1 uncharacterized protein LOC130497799 [Raphanus sativus]XP_056846986.1 uncharacterized protein LOC130497799 [Raphanus sativus]XP_056846987.1 uncharacterized protein LOC130497799 [Raphanus sativus]XP_056846988.1 unc